MQRSVLEYLEHTAAAYPNKAAFVGERDSLTFAQLMEQAQRVGTALHRALGGAVRRPIAVMEDHSPACIAAFMGVAYSGNCYVPIEAAMPRERLKVILDTLRPSAVLCVAEEPFTEKVDCPVLGYAQTSAQPSDTEALNGVRDGMIDIDPLYIIFTSGSTGQPKGVTVSHRSVIDFTDWLAQTAHISAKDVLANQAPFHFDMSGKDIYQALRSGATVHIFQPTDFVFPIKLIGRMNELAVTAVFWAAAAVRLVAASGALKKAKPESLRLMAFGGEALSAKHLACWQEALPETVYINMYGPTETTVDCAAYVVDRVFEAGASLPIGHACANKQLLLIGEDGALIHQPNVPGELYMRGSGMALGYFRDWNKTTSAFVQNPCHNDYPDLVYRTGDLAQYDNDGLLIYLSRRDHQIKHMGYRIELGEVETAVQAVDGVNGAICFFDDERDRIVLCYEGGPDRSGLIERLKDRLPKYMLPNIYIQKDRLPYTPNRKIDRVTLKEAYMRETADKRR